MASPHPRCQLSKGTPVPILGRVLLPVKDLFFCSYFCREPAAPLPLQVLNLDVLYTPALVHTFVFTIAISGRVELSLLCLLTYDDGAWTQILRAASRAGPLDMSNQIKAFVICAEWPPKSSRETCRKEIPKLTSFSRRFKRIQPTWVRAIRKSLP